MMKTKLIAFCGLLCLVGCNDFLDINEDPNNPTRADLSTLLPFVQGNMFGSFGFGTAGLSDILGVYSHHTVIRDNHDDYKVTSNEFSLVSAWEQNYAVSLPDLDQIIAQATKEERPVYAGIGKLLKAHSFSVMVDMWGDIPYSEAGNPTEFTFPRFDDDEAIYATLLDLVDEGIGDLMQGGAKPGSDDLVYGGDVDKWLRYGRSLKLNMYNKLRLTGLYDGNDVSSLLSSDLISTGSQDFELLYNTSISPENRHPGFIREYTQSNPQYYVSPYFYLLMKGEQACQNTLMEGISDPRIPYYFYNQLAPGEAAENPESYRDGEFLSIWFGSLDRDPNEGFDQSRSQTLVGLYAVGGAYDDGSAVKGSNTSGLRGAAAQRMLTAAAIAFVRAELALTMGTTDDARAMFEEGMRKSFDKVNSIASTAGAPTIVGDEINAYVNAVLDRYDAGDEDIKLELIMTQKWLQEFGSGVEAYNDIRRTGFPQVCDPAQDLNEYSIQTNPYPVSLPYSQSDLTNNSNAPAQRNQYTDKVFWDMD